MSQNVGELFVSLGVKGADKTLEAFTSVQSTLGKTASMSLEAKAGIAALFYGVEQLFSASMKAGTNISNLTAQLGVNGKALQQWGSAAEAAGVSSQSVYSSFQNIQNLMTKWQNNQGPPPALGRLLGVLGLSTQEFQSHANDLGWIMGQMNKFAQSKSLPVGLRNDVLNQWGLHDLIGPMARGQLNPDKISQMPYLTEAENKALAGMNSTFSKIETEWQKGLAKMIASGGPEFTKNIKDASNAFLELSKSLFELSKVVHVLELLSGLVGILGKSTSGLSSFIGSGVDIFKILRGDPDVIKEKDSLFKNIDPEMKEKLRQLIDSQIGSPSNVTTIINVNGPVDSNALHKISGAANDGVVNGLNQGRKQSRKQTK